MSLIKVRKIATLDGEDKRDGKDSIAADAKFKKGDKVRRGKQTGIVRDIEKEPYIEVKFTDQPVTVFVHESEIVAADSRAADASGTDAKFHVGQRVRAKDPSWPGYQGHALGNGLYTVKKVDSDGTVKLDGFLDVWISPSELVEANDACKDSGELNNDADLRAALSKMADIAKRLTDAKVSFKAGWTPDGIGEIILEFPNIESARKYNYYKLFNAWDAARSQIVPRWAVNIGGYRVPRIEGNRMTISILHFST